jgi:methyl-accepting chemotaxis protein
MTPDSPEFAVALSRMQDMSKDLQEIKASMKELASAVSRLAVIEERQANTSDSITRAFKEIRSVADRVTSLEQAQPMQTHSSEMVQTVTKYIVVAVLGAVISGQWVRQPSAPTVNPPAIVGK